MNPNEYEQFASKAYHSPSYIKPKQPPYAREQYPSRRYPQQGREFRSTVRPGLRKIVDRAIKENVDIDKLKAETAMFKKPFKVPFKWTNASRKAQREKDMVAVLFLNIKGEIEPPVVLPIYGNMVLLRNKIYEVDPRAFWTLRQGGKMFKFLIVKEIDRRPVSNLDLDEIRRRGDATDSDEFLIKMALRAQQTQTVKSMSKWAAILIGIVILGVLIFFFTR